jgi:hypothetical protein
VGSCLGNFLKSFGDAALPYVEGLMPSIAPLLEKSRPEEERRIALCIIDDMLEHSQAGRAKYLSQVGQQGSSSRAAAGQQQGSSSRAAAAAGQQQGSW